MKPISYLIIVPFILAILTIKNYKWFIALFYRIFPGKKETMGKNELTAGIIASSIFVMLWSIICFILINH